MQGGALASSAQQPSGSLLFVFGNKEIIGFVANSYVFNRPMSQGGSAKKMDLFLDSGNIKGKGFQELKYMKGYGTKRTE